MPLFGPPNIEKLKATRDVRGLIKALGHSDAEIRRGASLALGELADPRAVEPLARALEAEQEPSVRRAVAQALTKVAPPGSGVAREGTLHSSIAALTDESEYVRRGAAKALGRLGDARAAQPLMSALQDADKDVRLSAAESLRSFMSAEKVDELARDGQLQATVASLNEGDALRAAGAARALVSFGADAVQPLIGVLRHRDGSVRAAAAESLGRLGDARAVQPLIAALDDADIGVVISSATALGNLGDKRAAAALESIANLASERSRAFAAKEAETIARSTDWGYGKDRDGWYVIVDSEGEPMARWRPLVPDLREAAKRALLRLEDTGTRTCAVCGTQVPSARRCRHCGAELG
ncbi:MAG TPA: HEAT repeat domain-containing protein [Candidatus Limnocylindria bacterium]